MERQRRLKKVEVLKKTFGKSEEERTTLSRRRLLANLGGLAAVAGFASVNNGISKQSSKETSRESAERLQPSERFARAAESYETLFSRLTKDEVLFIDQYGAPIGEPRKVIFEEKTGRISQEWLDGERRSICEANPQILCNAERDFPRQLNVIAHLRGEPEGTTYIDLIRRNGHERKVLPLPGQGREQKGHGLSRIAFVQAHVIDTISPPHIRPWLSRLAPALIGKESTYENDVTSATGATNLAQIMPATAVGHGVASEDLKYLRNQVSLVGKLFSEHYAAIRHKAKEELEHFKHEYFGNDESALEENLLIPLTITAYNQGPARMIQLLRFARKKYPNRNSFETVHGTYSGSLGKDLFLILAQEAFHERAVSGFGKDGVAYWIGMEGLAVAMEKAKLLT